jgi:hypothetical protein
LPSSLHPVPCFTPVESPIIYAGDGKKRKHQLLIEGGGKALPFLTGFNKIARNEKSGFEHKYAYWKKFSQPVRSPEILGRS